MMRGVGLAVTLCVLLASFAASGAEPSARRLRARELFREGAALIEQERFREALAAFERAERLFPHASTTYNAGYCERSLGRLTRARRRFRDALAQREELSSKQRAHAHELLADVESRIRHLRVTLSSGALSVSVDGRPLEQDGDSWVAGTRAPGDPEAMPRQFTMLIDPGDHEFLLRNEKGREQLIERAVRHDGDLALGVEPEGAPPGRATPPTPYWGVRRIAAVGAAGVALATLATGGGLAGSAALTFDEADAACPDRQRCPDGRARELSSEALLHGNLATAAFVVAGAAAASAAILWWSAPEGGEAGVLLSPTGAAVRLRF
jgi:hypothetical protein